MKKKVRKSEKLVLLRAPKNGGGLGFGETLYKYGQCFHNSTSVLQSKASLSLFIPCITQCSAACTSLRPSSISIPHNQSYIPYHSTITSTIITTSLLYNKIIILEPFHLIYYPLSDRVSIFPPLSIFPASSSLLMTTTCKYLFLHTCLSIP